MDNLKVGSVVQLSSGGPLLTVVDIEEDQLKLVWINSNGEFFSARVNSEAVMYPTK